MCRGWERTFLFDGLFWRRLQGCVSVSGAQMAWYVLIQNLVCMLFEFFENNVLVFIVYVSVDVRR